MQGSAQNEASVYLFVTISLMLMGLTYGVIGRRWPRPSRPRSAIPGRR
ncbi:hypothetical protein FLP41_13745 [Paracoccus marcusii]|nr:hypothetical protein FLP41_13745 [Paracoccus marcusii]